MTHSSTFRFPGSPAKVGEEMGGGYTPPPVVVSYFDPRTGAPSPTKCEPLHSPKDRKGQFRLHSRGTAVEVDGKRYETACDAAAAIGCSKTTLNRALKDGRQCKGRTVRRIP